jgi:hypothetical protein
MYGTTPNGGMGSGCTGLGCGVLFQLKSNSRDGWTETVLHTFRGNGDGYVPYGGVIFGPGGLLYGATEFGGYKSLCDPNFNCGTVFATAP